IPCDGRDAVAELDAVALEPLRYFQRARVNFGVIGAMNGTFDGPRHDFLRAMILRGVFDYPMAKQRPVLHQSEHTHFPPVIRSLVAARSANDDCGPGLSSWN